MGTTKAFVPEFIVWIPKFEDVGHRAVAHSWPGVTVPCHRQESCVCFYRASKAIVIIIVIVMRMSTCILGGISFANVRAAH